MPGDHFPGGSDGKEATCSVGDLCSIPGWEDPLEEGMATHSSILAWRIPWTEEPGRLQSTGSQTVRHDWATKHSTDYFIHQQQKLRSSQSYTEYSPRYHGLGHKTHLNKTLKSRNNAVSALRTQWNATGNQQEKENWKIKIQVEIK